MLFKMDSRMQSESWTMGKRFEREMKLYEDLGIRPTGGRYRNKEFLDHLEWGHLGVVLQ